MSAFAARRLGALLTLFGALLLFAQPSGAFNYAAIAARAIASNVVADASAYDGISGGACTNVPHTGGTCTMTITNKSPKTVDISVGLTSDPSSKVNTYQLTGTSAVSAGAVKVTSIAPGSSTTLTANLKICLTCLTGQTNDIYWTVWFDSAHAINATRASFHMTVTWA